MSESVHVGIAKLHVAKNPVRLICLGLGSCVAVALWDPSTKIGGLAHIMLPNSSIAKKSSKDKPAKYGDTAVDMLLEEMKKRGANRYLVVAKIAGGSHMFKTINLVMEDIGKKNIESVKNAIKRLHLRLVSEDVGGSVGRSVELDTETGKLIIRGLKGASRML